jgi:hypothetical protein
VLDLRGNPIGPAGGAALAAAAKARSALARVFSAAHSRC